jgi:hypothetical protein
MVGPAAPFLVTAFLALFAIVPVWLKFHLPVNGNSVSKEVD